MRWVVDDDAGGHEARKGPAAREDAELEPWWEARRGFGRKTHIYLRRLRLCFVLDRDGPALFRFLFLTFSNGAVLGFGVLLVFYVVDCGDGDREMGRW
jgi:hypothetical protein